MALREAARGQAAARLGRARLARGAAVAAATGAGVVLRVEQDRRGGDEPGELGGAQRHGGDDGLAAQLDRGDQQRGREGGVGRERADGGADDARLGAAARSPTAVE